MDKLKKSFESINFRLFFALLLMGFLPTIYTTVRIFFLGQMPNNWGYNIASQLSWVNIIYEIVQEALILPLFFLIGQSQSNKIELKNKIITGLLVCFVIYTILSLLIIIFAKPLILLMAQDTKLIQETITYIRLETIAKIFATLVKFIIIVFVTINKNKYLYILLITQMILSILFDTFFVSNLKFSLKLGVNGIAITNIIVNVVLLITSIFLLNKEEINIFKKNRMSFSWMRKWAKVGFYSGLESFVRNFAFMVMIIRMVNVVGQQGNFWLANSFIWSWLLLPIIQLGELIKQDCAINEKTIEKRSLGYFALTTIIVSIWLISIPLWKPFMHNIMNIKNEQIIFKLCIISLGFYILFAYNNVIDSIFYGIGKTNYMLFQSVIVNSTYYGIIFVLYITKIYQPTLINITLMFAIGTAIDSVLTFGIFYWMLRRKNISIIKNFDNNIALSSN